MNKKKIVFYVLGVVGLVLLITGVSYAYFEFYGTGLSELSMSAQRPIPIVFYENNNINLENQFPMPDSEGINQDGLDTSLNFSISSGVGVNYAVALTEVVPDNFLTEDYIKIYLLKDGQVAAGFTENQGNLIATYKNKYIENQIDEYVILTDRFTSESTHNYTLKAWISEDYQFSNTYVEEDNRHGVETAQESFSFKMKIVATTEQLTILTR